MSDSVASKKPTNFQYLQFFAPTENSSVYCFPAWDVLPSNLAQNKLLRQQSDVSLLGTSLLKLSEMARTRLITKAIEFSGKYRETSFTTKRLDSKKQATILLSGHQPQIFHPGVWLKNFALSRLAQEQTALGINLIIDSDLCHSASLRVPAGRVSEPRLESVLLDQQQADIPYEERKIVSKKTFEAFATQAQKSFGPYHQESILEQYWTLAKSSQEQTENNLGLTLAQARHQLEAIWGNETLEIPQSVVCDFPEFQHFLLHILVELPRFTKVYNAALAEYRAAHHLRSSAHPVPDLTSAGSWQEAPFWIYTTASPFRRPLFIRRSKTKIIISNRHEIEINIPYTETLETAVETSRAIATLQKCREQGVKIRSRALTTTLFARLLLSDLFMHGIGGAKYDQVTNHIIERFFKRPAPTYMTLSGTLRLPLKYRSTSFAEVQSLKQQIRQTEYHPERLLQTAETAGPIFLTAEILELIEQKKKSVAVIKTIENCTRRHASIVASNLALQPHIRPLKEQLFTQLKTAQKNYQTTELLGSREFSFCLFSEEDLRRFLTQPIG